MNEYEIFRKPCKQKENETVIISRRRILHKRKSDHTVLYNSTINQRSIVQIT